MTTRDVIFGGRVVLHQPARGRGYRVNADALLLADFSAAARGLLFDLGAGVGAISLVMLARGLATRAVLVDDDDNACALAERNIEANGADGSVVRGDVLAVSSACRGQASLVVCNPPYFDPSASRGAHGARSRARHGDLDRFVQAARAVLGRRGRACFVYPATELARLFSSLRAVGLEPKRLRLVHPRVSSPARVAMVEARASKPGGLVTMPPLIERDGPHHGDYTKETARALGLL